MSLSQSLNLQSRNKHLHLTFNSTKASENVALHVSSNPQLIQYDHTNLIITSSYSCTQIFDTDTIHLSTPISCVIDAYRQQNRLNTIYEVSASEASQIWPCYQNKMTQTFKCRLKPGTDPVQQQIIQAITFLNIAHDMSRRTDFKGSNHDLFWICITITSYSIVIFSSSSIFVPAQWPSLGHNRATFSHIWFNCPTFTVHRIVQG